MWGVKTQVAGMRPREEEEGRTEKRTRAGTTSGTRVEGGEEAVAEQDGEDLEETEGGGWTGKVGLMEEEVTVVEEQVYPEGQV